jgi:hypothetical protein
VPTGCCPVGWRILMCVKIRSHNLEDCSENEIVYKVVKKTSIEGTYCSPFPLAVREPQQDINKLGIMLDYEEPCGYLQEYSIGVKVKAMENTPLFYCFTNLRTAIFWYDLLTESSEDICVLACTAEGKKFYGSYPKNPLKGMPPSFDKRTINVEYLTPIRVIHN